MVIIKPTCGLGNQMFSYAVGRALAARHGAELYVDKSYYHDGSQDAMPAGASVRAYGLDVFNVKTEEIKDYAGMTLWRVRSRRFHKRLMALAPCLLLNHLRRGTHILHFVEKGLTFDPFVLKLPDQVLLEGCFVSYKYFEHCRGVICEDFSFRHAPDAANKAMLEQTAAVDSVSLHVRRGDFVANKIVAERFGLCSLDYYQRAVDYVVQRVKSPHFFIFSDDLQWARDNLKTGFATEYVTHNLGQQDHEDLRLMAACKHNIIANSTFSWWGAWLNPNVDKIVIAPTPAFDKLGTRDDDLYPPSWVRLPRR
jgi:hypothetical protein